VSDRDIVVGIIGIGTTLQLSGLSLMAWKWGVPKMGKLAHTLWPAQVLRRSDLTTTLLAFLCLAAGSSVGRADPVVTYLESGGQVVAEAETSSPSASLLDGFPNDPMVIKDGNTYAMYYAAVKGDFSDTNTVRVFRATSNDGVNWIRDSIPRLSPGSDGSWDSVKVERPSIIRLPDSTYRIYYAGSNVRDAEGGFQIGLATSPDGIDWSTYTGNPVLTVGEPGSFDELSILGARVLLKDGEYWMWYAGMSGDERLSIGLAKSQDGIVWEKKGKVLELDVEGEGRNEVGVSEGHVIWNGVEFEMFYALLQDNGQVRGPIWHATSTDGINWIKDGNPIISRGDETSWTSQGIGSPSVLLEGGTYRMWYSGTHTDWASFLEIGIGVAEKIEGLGGGEWVNLGMLGG
jgi:predicted GH43/DUF377 family glycosyl hydrolase